MLIERPQQRRDGSGTGDSTPVGGIGSRAIEGIGEIAIEDLSSQYEGAKNVQAETLVGKGIAKAAGHGGIGIAVDDLVVIVDIVVSVEIHITAIPRLQGSALESHLLARDRIGRD